MDLLQRHLVQVSVFIFALWSCGSDEKGKQVGSETGIAKIIFDTDMGPDYDDVGALTVLNVLANRGECDILATVASDRHPSVAPTIELLNQYFGRDSVPVGMATCGAPDFIAENGGNDTLINTYASHLRNKSYPDAVSVYRQVLASQPDHSVTIVTVGFLSNLSVLLDSQPDKYSELNGVNLVSVKVKRLVAMAGAFPEGSEFNVNQHAVASIYTFRKWPTPVLFRGAGIGARIFTGKRSGGA